GYGVWGYGRCWPPETVRHPPAPSPPPCASTTYVPAAPPRTRPGSSANYGKGATGSPSSATESTTLPPWPGPPSASPWAPAPTWPSQPPTSPWSAETWTPSRTPPASPAARWPRSRQPAVGLRLQRRDRPPGPGRPAQPDAGRRRDVRQLTARGR